MGRKSASESGIRDDQPGSYFLELRNHFLVKILKFFDADPGWKKVGSGIRDKHPGSATLPEAYIMYPTLYGAVDFLIVPSIACMWGGGGGGTCYIICYLGNLVLLL